MQNTLPIVIFLPIQSAIVPNAKLPTNMPAMYTLWAKDFFHWSSQTMPKSMVAVEVNTPVSATHPWVHFSVSVSEYWSSWHVDSTDLFSRLNKEGVGWRSIYWEEIFQIKLLRLISWVRFASLWTSWYEIYNNSISFFFQFFLTNSLIRRLVFLWINFTYFLTFSKFSNFVYLWKERLREFVYISPRGCVEFVYFSNFENTEFSV